jgi:hypothetical protein
MTNAEPPEVGSLYVLARPPKVVYSWMATAPFKALSAPEPSPTRTTARSPAVNWAKADTDKAENATNPVFSAFMDFKLSYSFKPRIGTKVKGNPLFS